jgi:hypothetical protein
MKALSLNCRGLGNPQTVNEFHEIVRKEGPNVVFLIETHLANNNLEWLRVRMRMRGCFGVEGHGQGGGLALLWDATMNVSVQSYSAYHIDAKVI